MMFGAMLGAVALMAAAPQVAHSGSSGVVMGAAALNLRSCADTTCPRVAVIPGGAGVSIDGASGGWYHVSYKGAVGYASAHYISTSGANATVTSKMIKMPQPTPYYPASNDSDSSGSHY